MSRYIFLFDLDSTVTKQEILPTISKKLGIYEKMSELTESTMRGEVPFKQSFLQRVDLLKNVPVSEVNEMVSKIQLNNHLVDFIRVNHDRCYIVTGNLDVCIAIRLVYKKNGEICIRSGAGIVADSVPEKEFDECCNKARAVVLAIEKSQEGLE